jgi:hypothetical protein
LTKYRASNGLINYAEFCDNVNHVFSDTCNQVDVIENSKSTASFTDAEKGIAMDLLLAIKT